MHTSTSSSPYFRWYTSRTSSIAHTKRASAFGGMHQHSFSQGLSLFFFSVRRTVSALTAPTISHSTSRSASNRIVHLTRPSGGSPQAIATSRASASPSRTFGRRFNCRFRFSADSMPSSTHRRRTRATVATPMSSPSATSRSVRPPPSRPSSHCSRMRACVCFRADARPLFASAFNCSRSASASSIRYVLLGIVNTPCPSPQQRTQRVRHQPVISSAVWY